MNNKLDHYEAIKCEAGSEVADYLSGMASLEDERVLVLPSDSSAVLDPLPEACSSTIIHLRRLNHTKHLNAFLKLVNVKLEQHGHLVCCFEAKHTHKHRLLSRYPWGIKRVVYAAAYVRRNRGDKRILTQTEVLGRLYAAGFELMSQKQLGELHYLQLRKVALPTLHVKSHYGMLIKLPRVGKGGQMIQVYKLRTMHPYAEYIQAYVYQINAAETGEMLVKDDFRINSAGKFLRRYWIDELPMFVNLLKGELKLVGVRPVSRHRYETYPKELQQKRILTKPGLVPPYYADMPKTEEELWASEDRYLDAYMRHPWRTDWRYFWKAFYNIVFRGERSS